MDISGCVRYSRLQTCFRRFSRTRTHITLSRGGLVESGRCAEVLRSDVTPAATGMLIRFSVCAAFGPGALPAQKGSYSSLANLIPAEPGWPSPPAIINPTACNTKRPEPESTGTPVGRFGPCEAGARCLPRCSAPEISGSLSLAHLREDGDIRDDPDSFAYIKSSATKQIRGTGKQRTPAATTTIYYMKAK